MERAFRSYKTVDLKVRPIHHRLEGRVRAHVFLRMLAHHVEWHMRRALAPILLDDDAPGAAEALRASPAKPSPAARAKAARKRTPEGLPVHSFRTLLADLATLTKNRVPSRPEPRPPRSSPAPLRSRPKPSASSASAHDTYPVAYTRRSALCHRPTTS